MQFLLTQQELDEIKASSADKFRRFRIKLSNELTTILRRDTYLEVGAQRGPNPFVFFKDLKVAIENAEKFAESGEKIDASSDIHHRLEGHG